MQYMLPLQVFACFALIYASCAFIFSLTEPEKSNASYIYQCLHVLNQYVYHVVLGST